MNIMTPVISMMSVTSKELRTIVITSDTNCIFSTVVTIWPLTDIICYSTRIFILFLEINSEIKKKEKINDDFYTIEIINIFDEMFRYSPRFDG